MRIQITGSKSHRVWKCPASAVLPQVEQSEAHPSRGRGVAIHEFLERVGTIGVEDAIQLAPEDVRPLLSLLDVDELPTKCATEVAFAWDWKARTGRELGRNIDRAYGELGPTETALTVDILGSVVDGGIFRGLVGDYKSGRTKYPAPDRFGQTMLGALAARSVHGFDEVLVDLYYLGDDGESYRARRSVDAWDLDCFADEWANAMQRVDLYEADVFAGRTPDVVEGLHCAYCPALKACPAKLALASRLPTEIDGIIRTGLPMTVERAAVTWVAIERFEKLLDALKAEITTLAASHPIELPDGRVVEHVESAKRALSARVAWDVLTARYGVESAQRAAKFTISIEALKAEVQAKKPANQRLTNREGTGALDAILREIDDLGGLEMKRSSYVRAHVRKK